MQEDGPPTGRGDAPRGLFTPRWVELQQTYGIEPVQGRRSEIFIHRMPPSGILHMPPWERVVATHFFFSCIAERARSIVGQLLET